MATVTRDFIIAVEELSTAPTLYSQFSSAFSFDFGVGSYSLGNVVGIEWRSGNVGTIISRDFVIAVEELASAPTLYNPWSSAFSIDFGVGPFTLGNIVDIEWRSGVSTGTTAFEQTIIAIEWRSAFVSDKIISSEIKASNLNSGSVIPAEWQATASGSNVHRDAIIGIEWGSRTQRDAVVRADFLQSYPSLPNPWSSDYSSVDFGIGPYTINTVFPIEWGITSGTTTGITDTIQIEWGSTTGVSSVAITEIKASYQGTTVIPMEWNGTHISYNDNPIPIEWRTAVFKDTIVTAEYNATAVVTAIDNTEWRSTFNKDAVMPVEAGSNLLRDTSVASEWITSVAVNSTTAAEYSATFVRDYIIGTTPMASALVDTIMITTWNIVPVSVSEVIPIEFGGSVIQSTDIIPIEWKMSLNIDAAVGVEYKASLQKDTIAQGEYSGSVTAMAVVPAEAKATIFEDYVVPTEFGHLTTSLIANFLLPLEFNIIVTVDFVFDVDRSHKRKFWGAQLEPDEWEEEHEP